MIFKHINVGVKPTIAQKKSVKLPVEFGQQNVQTIVSQNNAPRATLQYATESRTVMIQVKVIRLPQVTILVLAMILVYTFVAVMMTDAPKKNAKGLIWFGHQNVQIPAILLNALVLFLRIGLSLTLLD